ncbi:unnamed protein product [Taenia asiatica]|uniref:50S ribosomal protein L15e n=1 Tax=Taenia asiatica TaxID=60517 RepID=A0A0R3WF51_TAEAS|nr:unnamed protein product [Taenia asiatica]
MHPHRACVGRGDVGLNKESNVTITEYRGRWSKKKAERTLKGAKKNKKENGKGRRRIAAKLFRKNAKCGT